MRKFLIGAAAIAMAASGAYAEPGKGNGGGGNGKGGGQDHAAMNHGGGGGGGGKADKGPSMREAKADRGPSIKSGNGNGNANRAAKADRGPSMKAERGKAERSVERRVEREVRGNSGRDVRDVNVRYDRNVNVRYDRDNVRTVVFDRRGDYDYGYVDGCPPGLAKKNNGCMPPGLAKQRDIDWQSAYYQPSWWGYDRVGDGRYYYDDGYLYRVNNSNSILGYIPLLGGALSVGNPWPDYYAPVSVPDYYVDYYNLGPSGGYRYADDVLYRVDPNTSSITSIAALLTGDTFGIGQPMPSGYDVYNVPYGYQDRYYDTDDAYYRYADGYVYEVDPTTQLIQAAIELLV
ncbi:hypothetical protein ACWPMX_02285 [Tsuneonella sp. HG094]